MLRDAGIRVVKAFARESRQLTRFQDTVGRVFNQAMVATRLEATYNPVIGFLPQLGLAAVLLLRPPTSVPRTPILTRRYGN